MKVLEFVGFSSFSAIIVLTLLMGEMVAAIKSNEERDGFCDAPVRDVDADATCLPDDDSVAMKDLVIVSKKMQLHGSCSLQACNARVANGECCRAIHECRMKKGNCGTVCQHLQVHHCPGVARDCAKQGKFRTLASCSCD